MSPADSGTQDTDLTGTHVGRFLVRRRIGGGGMGEVYLAEDTLLPRLVALKRLASQLRGDHASQSRLLNEARLASMVTHTHLARVYDAFERNDETFIVMEYVEGESLGQRLRRGRLGSLEWRRIASEVASALEAAHRAGIVHGDLKPDNVLLEAATGAAKVCDFGVARRVTALASTDTTQLGSAPIAPMSGTPAYMAPEVLLGEAASAASDVFALGVLCCEMATGVSPFSAGSLIATANKVLNDTLPDLSDTDVPEALRPLVASMADKTPASRPTAAGVLQALNNERHTSPPVAPSPFQTADRSEASRRPGSTDVDRRRSRILIAGGVGTLVVALALVLTFVTGTRRPAPAVDTTGDLLNGQDSKNLVVLQFTTTGEESIGEGLITGLTETLHARLSEVTAGSSLQLIAPRSSSGSVITVADARAELGAHVVLSGSVQRSDGRLRVSLVLTDAGSGRLIRGDSMTVADDDPFEIQDQVVRSVARLLVAPELPAVGAAERSGTKSGRAYEHYLQGRGYLRDYDRLERVELAVAAFERALTFDDQYALAHAGLGEASWRTFELTRDVAWVERARDACTRATSLGEALPEAEACTAMIQGGTGSNAEAAAGLERALAVDGTNELWMSMLATAYERLGRHAEAEATHRRAISLRPKAWTGYNELGTFYVRQRRYAEAAEAFSMVVELAPDSFRGHANLGVVYFAQGVMDSAVTAFERSMAIRPNFQAASNLGTAAFARRDYARAVIAFERASALNEREYRVWINLGDAYLWNGSGWQAHEAFTKACGLLDERVRVNPNDPQVLIALGECSAALGRTSDAQGYLDRAVAAAPESPLLLLRAGVVTEFFFGRRAQALALVRRARRAGLSDAELARVQALEDLRGELAVRE